MTNFIEGLVHRVEGGRTKSHWLSVVIGFALLVSGSAVFLKSIDAQVSSWSWFLTAIALFLISGWIFYRSTSPHQSESIISLDKMVSFLDPLMSSSEILVWVASADRKYQWLSDAWLRFTGKTLEEERNDGWIKGVHPDDLDSCIREYMDAFDLRRPFRLTYRLKHHTGQYRWLVDCGCPLYGSQHEFLGYVGTCMEIHQEKLKWDEWGSLAANRARLISETSREAQDPLVDIYRLLQSVTHSLSNPDTATSRHGVRDSVARLKTRFREVAGLIDQMVDQSLVTKEDDSLKLSVQSASLSDVAGSAIKMFESRAQQKGVAMSLKGDAGLKGLFDVFRLERVFWTILRIMIDQLPPKSEISLEIDRAGPEADWAQVRVKGMSSVKTSEPSNTVDENQTSVQWTKDLSLANKIIEKHSGMLEAHHTLDGNTEFKVVVPLREAA